MPAGILHRNTSCYGSEWGRPYRTFRLFDISNSLAVDRVQENAEVCVRTDLPPIDKTVKLQRPCRQPGCRQSRNRETLRIISLEHIDAHGDNIPALRTYQFPEQSDRHTLRCHPSDRDEIHRGRCNGIIAGRADTRARHCCIDRCPSTRQQAHPRWSGSSRSLHRTRRNCRATTRTI